MRKSVRAIGRCAIKVEQAAERCVSTLIDLIQTKVNYVVQEAIVVIKVKNNFFFFLLDQSFHFRISFENTPINTKVSLRHCAKIWIHWMNLKLGKLKIRKDLIENNVGYSERR